MMRQALFFMPRAKSARGKVRGALPRTPPGGHPPGPPARFPFCPMFRNGPRRQGFASPRKIGAPLTAPGRSEDLPMRRESGQIQSPFAAPSGPPVGRARSCATTLE